jgi:hypothetical protein
MELIINLIVVFVIIISILKRIQAGGTKRKMLNSPRTSEYEPEPIFPDKIAIKEISKKISELNIPSNTESMHVHENSSVREQTTSNEEAIPVLNASVSQKRGKALKIIRRRSSFLQFGETELVQGILMREILGDPLSMRETWM